MDYAYPCLLEPEEDAAGYVVSFPDVPEALTGAETWEESLKLAENALVVALGAYVRAGENIPVPSRPAAEHSVVSVPPNTAAQLALYTAMRRKGVTPRSLAETLGIREARVRRLLDLNRPTRLDYLATALRTLGRRLVIGDREAPESTAARAATG